MSSVGSDSLSELTVEGADGQGFHSHMGTTEYQTDLKGVVGVRGFVERNGDRRFRGMSTVSELHRACHTLEWVQIPVIIWRGQGGNHDRTGG